MLTSRPLYIRYELVFCFFFLSLEPFRALTRSVKESALSYHINTDITPPQQRATSLIWRFSSNEFRVIIDKKEKWVMALWSRFALWCIKCLTWVALGLMTILRQPAALFFFLFLKLTTNRLECLQKV